MPKEIVHWTIAEIAKEKLKGESKLLNIIDNFYSEYLTGSIAFDIPYFDFFSSNMKEMIEIGKNLHGIDKDFAQTNYEKMIDFYISDIPKGFWAFVAGTFCHALTDIYYHPVVAYYTKDSVKSHREFEVKLDLHYLNRTNLPGNGSLNKIIKGIMMKKRDFLTMLAMFIFGKNRELTKKVSDNLFKYRSVQFLIRQKWAYYLFGILNILSFGNLSDILALFYKDYQPKNFEIFENPLYFIENGELKQSYLSEIEIRTVDEILKYFNILENLISSNNLIEIKKFFYNLRFPPLYVGVKNEEKK